MNYKYIISFLATKQQKDWSAPASDWVALTSLGKVEWEQEAKDEFPEVFSPGGCADLTKITDAKNFSHLFGSALDFNFSHLFGSALDFMGGDKDISVGCFHPNNRWEVWFDKITKRTLLVEGAESASYIQKALDYIDGDNDTERKRISLK